MHKQISMIGDTSALNNWTYKEHPFFVILMFSFSFLVVIYLMNLLIGLLNMEIGKDDNRVSYLIQKAEVFINAILNQLISYKTV